MNRQIKSMIAMFILGIAAIGMGIWNLLSDRADANNCTESVMATVVDWETEEEYNSTIESWETDYYPVVSFDADGQTVTARYSQYYTDEQFDIGQQIEINYDPTDPEYFVVAGEHRGTFSAIWMIPVGIVLMVIPIVKAAAYRRIGKGSV